MMYYPGFHSPSGHYQQSNSGSGGGLHALQRRAVKPLPLLSFSNGKGYTALAQCHLDRKDGEVGD